MVEAPPIKDLKQHITQLSNKLEQGTKWHHSLMMKIIETKLLRVHLELISQTITQIS